ncbi:MAG: DUF429 domain-containing protein [Phycisphaerales bacterium]
MTEPIIAGVDGCRGGWCAALAQLRGDVLIDPRCMLVSEFRSILDLVGDDGIVCVDIPIGLLEQARPLGRDVDQQARRELSPLRSSSVFSAPIRAVLGIDSYEEALRVSRESSVHRLGLSKQAHNICPKIAEVDSAMTPALQERIVEVHPELCFKQMAGATMAAAKREPAGRAARIEALGAAGLAFVTTACESLKSKSAVADDDIIDAHAALWTARRFALGTARQILRTPPIDAKGLRMEMWA